MSYYFNLPKYEDLNLEQQMAVEETESICLSGAPGTGKTVVNLWRHIYNYENGNADSLLLTYTKTLEHYLKITAKSKNEDAAKNIDRTYRWTHNKNKRNYNEIIIDEAQDAAIDNYRIINRYADKVSYGADPNQGVFLTKEEIDELLIELKNLFPDNEEYPLYKNFRNSKEILLFTKSIFPSMSIPQNTIDDAEETGIKPIVQMVGWDDEEIFEKIIEVINAYSSDTHNIGILVPSVKQVNYYYELLKNNTNCSKYENEMQDFNNLTNIHITTFKSAKGIEFDTVIIPKFDSYKWFIENTDRIKVNDYYVALTRAKINLFLICVNSLTIAGNTYEIE